MLLKIFLLLNSLKKKFENFLQSISLKKKNRKFFTANFIEKKFQKFFTVNLRLLKNFLLLNSLQKKSKIFYSQFHWKKILKIFQKIRKKIFCLKKKNGHRGVKCSFFFSKIRHHLSLGFDIIYLKSRKYSTKKSDKQNVFKIAWMFLISSHFNMCFLCSGFSYMFFMLFLF